MKKWKLISAVFMFVGVVLFVAQAANAAPTYQTYNVDGFTVSGLQGINPNSPDTSSLSSVGSPADATHNTELNNPNSIGVVYTDSKNKSHNFGLGLTGLTPDTSTGLEITAPNGTSINSNTTITLSDFDINQKAVLSQGETVSAAGGFLSNKVAPALLLFDTNGNFVNSYSSDKLSNYLTYVDESYNVDNWNLNIAALNVASNIDLGSLVFYADYPTGFCPKSDPYFLTNISGGTTNTPEPATILLLGVALLGMMGIRRKVTDN